MDRVNVAPRKGKRWWVGMLLGLTALSGSAEEIEISGRIAAAGRPLAGATVELRSFAGTWETAKAQLEGRARPPAVATTRSGRDGRFKITAPEAGAWTVVARHPKHLAMSCELKPLLGPVELPPVELSRRRPRRITALDGEGRPLAGVRLEVRGRTPGSSWDDLRWRPERRSGTTDEHGRAVVPSAADETLRVAGLGKDAFGTSRARPGAGEVSLRLTDRLVPARLLDDSGRPAPGLAGLASDLALGVTGAGGEIRVPYRQGEGVPKLTFAGTAGLVGWVESKAAPEQVLVLRLPPTRRVHGRVLDAASREPIAGAWVWSAHGLQRTGPRGGYSLRLPAIGRWRFAVAAPDYLQQIVEVPAADSTVAGDRAGDLTLVLVKFLTLTGRVVDAGGEAVGGADVVAMPDRGSRPTVRSQLAWPVVIWRQVQALSLPGGRFRI